VFHRDNYYMAIHYFTEEDEEVNSKIEMLGFAIGRFNVHPSLS
jgi:hypothetical protein